MTDMTNLAGDRINEELWRLVNDPDINRRTSARAVEDAMRRGLSLDLATRLYGFVDPVSASE